MFLQFNRFVKKYFYKILTNLKLYDRVYMTEFL